MISDSYAPPPYTERIRAASRWQRLALVGLAMLISLAGAVVAAVVLLDYPTDDLPKLAAILLAAATGSLLIGGALLWLLSERRGRRVAARLITAHVIGILVVVVIVGLASMLLFDSTHDFQLLGLFLAYAVAIAAIYSAFVSGWFTSSVGDLAAASRRIVQGDLSTRLPSDGEQEFADLGGAMNTLAGRLQFAYQRQRSLEESQRYLLAAMITELQDPIASLDRGLEGLSRGDVSDSSSVRRLAVSLQRELAAQQNLLDHLDQLARLESGSAGDNPVGFNLSAQVLSACERLGPQATVLGVRLLPRVDFAMRPVLGNPEQVSTILDHMTGLAMRQESAGGSVLIEVLDLGHEAQVNIANSASPPGGSQLKRSVGLVIAHRMIELNAGRVWTVQPLTGGTVTSFTLPLAVEQQTT